MNIHGLSYLTTIKRSFQRLSRMRHKKLLTVQILNELMYDFDKKSKQNIQAIYYGVSRWNENAVT